MMRIALSSIDPKKEQQRLRDHYATMTDEELEQLAANSSELSDISREALRHELSLRGIAADFLQAGWDAIEHHPLVTIQRFRDLPQALIAKGWIESAGIEAFLANENIVRMDWFYSNLVGGVSLLVKREDEPQAREVLDQPIPEEFEVEGLGEYRQPRCPQCQSLDVSSPGSNTGAAYASAYLSVPLPFQSANWKCLNCGNEWNVVSSAG